MGGKAEFWLLLPGPHRHDDEIRVGLAHGFPCHGVGGGL